MTHDERAATLEELDDITTELFELAKRLHDVAARIDADEKED